MPPTPKNGAIHDLVDAQSIEDHLTWALDGAIELALIAGLSRAKLASILAEEINGVLDPLVASTGVADRLEHALNDPFVPTDNHTVEELKACEQRPADWFEMPPGV